MWIIPLKKELLMLHRWMKIKLSPWGAGLVVLMTGLGESEVRFLQESTGVVEGTVSGPQGPLPEGGATVVLTLAEGAIQEWSEEQSLQPNGYYLFPQVPPGKYSLRVDAEGFTGIQILQHIPLIVREESTNRRSSNLHYS